MHPFFTCSRVSFHGHENVSLLGQRRAYLFSSDRERVEQSRPNINIGKLLELFRIKLHFANVKLILYRDR